MRAHRAKPIAHKVRSENPLRLPLCKRYVAARRLSATKHMGFFSSVLKLRDTAALASVSDRCADRILVGVGDQEVCVCAIGTEGIIAREF